MAKFGGGVAALFVAVALTGCAVIANETNPVQCRQDMRADFYRALAEGDPEKAREILIKPASCQGLPESEIQHNTEILVREGIEKGYQSKMEIIFGEGSGS